ncbi:MAG: serine/threonine protein kinase [Myxococcales bacterium]|nr:serine/threonine protein kinase [Myxococcales bacterium]
MTECLDDAVLLGFAEHRLAPAIADHVERHIDACSACRRLLAMLAPTEAAPGGPASGWDVGSVVADRWALEALLGEGGMGRVFRARDESTGESVALKLMQSDTLEHAQRFAREAQLSARVLHPNVLSVREAITIDHAGTLALVMELLHGESLEQRLRRVGALELVEVKRIALDLSRAAGAAHAQGIVHRDIKPANVFLEASGRLRLLDFGLAKAFTTHPALSTLMRLTESGTVLGTPSYMAPEQVRGESDIDARADVWSLGAVVYRLLSGRPPVVGKSYGEIFRRMSEPIPPLAALRADLPSSLAPVVEFALAHDREARPANGEAFARELAAAW